MITDYLSESEVAITIRNQLAKTIFMALNFFLILNVNSERQNFRSFFHSQPISLIKLQNNIGTPMLLGGNNNV